MVGVIDVVSVPVKEFCNICVEPCLRISSLTLFDELLNDRICHDLGCTRGWKYDLKKFLKFGTCSSS